MPYIKETVGHVDDRQRDVADAAFQHEVLVENVIPGIVNITCVDVAKQPDEKARA